MSQVLGQPSVSGTLLRRVAAGSAAAGPRSPPALRVARDAASFGRIGRRRRVASAARDAYGGYCDAVDRAVAVAGESFVAGEDAG